MKKYYYLNKIFPSYTKSHFAFSTPLIFTKSPWINDKDLQKVNVNSRHAANIKLLGGIIGLAFGILISLNLNSILVSLIMIVVLCAVGYFVFDIYILDRIKYLDLQIAAETPMFLDLLASELEVSSRNIIEAIDLVSKSYKCLLTSKIRYIFKLLPITSSGALMEKLDTELKNPEISELSKIIEISQKFGVNPSPAVKNLAERTHESRLLRSKDLGQKSAAALLIPLIVFFLPVTAIIVLIPAFLGILK